MGGIASHIVATVRDAGPERVAAIGRTRDSALEGNHIIGAQSHSLSSARPSHDKVAAYTWPQRQSSTSERLQPWAVTARALTQAKDRTFHRQTSAVLADTARSPLGFDSDRHSQGLRRRARRALSSVRAGIPCLVPMPPTESSSAARARSIVADRDARGHGAAGARARPSSLNDVTRAPPDMDLVHNLAAISNFNIQLVAAARTRMGGRQLLAHAYSRNENTARSEHVTRGGALV